MAGVETDARPARRLLQELNDARRRNAARWRVGVIAVTLVCRSRAPRSRDMVVTADNERRQSTSARSLKAIVDFAVGIARARGRAAAAWSRCLSFLPGFFSIPPIDRDEARFAQATKQMVESGDYIDIRFQDEVRYKKPVGIYWLQAGVVKAAQRARRSARAHDDLALSDALAARRHRRGAADLLGGARLRLAPRRVLAGLMMASCVLLGIERLIAKTDAMLLLTVGRRHGRDGARLSAGPARAARPAARLAVAGDVLDRARRRRAAQGAADRDDRRRSPSARSIVVDRSARWLLRAAAAVGRRLARAPGAAVVPRHRRPRRRGVLRRVGRAGPAQQGRRAARSPMARRPATISCCSG